MADKRDIREDLRLEMANNRKSGTGSHGNSPKRSFPSGERRVREYVHGNFGRADSTFHLKLKHVLGGVSLLSLLAAFEVFSIPTGSGIIDLLGLARIAAAEVWFGVAISAGFLALILHAEENEK